jgi:hypothetical protein
VEVHVVWPAALGCVEDEADDSHSKVCRCHQGGTLSLNGGDGEKGGAALHMARLQDNAVQGRSVGEEAQVEKAAKAGVCATEVED